MKLNIFISWVNIFTILYTAKEPAKLAGSFIKVAI